MSKRDEIRAFLRSQWDGVTVTRVAEEVGLPYDNAFNHLKNMRKRGEVCRDDERRWYYVRNGVVPEHVRVMPTKTERIVSILASDSPPVDMEAAKAALAEAVMRAQEDEEPAAPPAPAEEADRVSFVPAAELEKPKAVSAPVDFNAPDVEIRITVPTWVARRVFDVLEAARWEALEP